MKTKNILCAFLTGIFILTTMTMNAQTKVYVHKSDHSATVYNIDDLDSISFNPPAATGVDYSKLKLNEISGVGSDNEKFYELINIGPVDISLENCKIYYNNDPFGVAGDGPLTWTGSADQVIKAGELFSLIGRNTPGSFSTGLTAQRNIKITFRDPDENLIDEFIRAQDADVYAISDKSFSRIPDGTGPFYFSIPTPDAKNGGALLVPTTQAQTPNIDYSQLVLNEIDGNSKSIELYNKGTVAIPLTGVTLWKNETGTAWWTGSAASGSIDPDSYVVIYQTTKNPGGSDVAGFIGANGISTGQTLKFELRDPDRNSLGIFQRGGPTWSQDISSVGSNSFQRIPNGTGDWKQALPTIGTVNAENGTDIPDL